MTSSEQKYGGGKVKPIPSTYQARLEEVESLKCLGKSDVPCPRAHLYHFMNSSKQNKRSPCHASILFVGSSGVGKSSTINHLLDSGDAIQLAKTSKSRSETRNTSEFILTVDEPKFEVSNLQLGIVDTPGFNDTDGFRQDACNFYSIKQFYKTHPKLSGCYPNLIFLVVQATDTRIEGPNSNLSKSLRCLKQLGLVDKRHPNIVAILSFCCSLNFKKVAKWEKEMEEKKEIVRLIVSEALSVLPRVVLLENKYGEDEWELEVDGDFTRLPNGELQPKNLYNACKEVLKANSDHFGLMTLNACFKKPKKYSEPTAGHKTKATNASEDILTVEEEQFVELLEKAAKGGQDDPITETAEQYAKMRKLNPEQEKETKDIAFSLKRMGVEDKNDCTSLSKGTVEYFHGKEISSTGEDMLKERFGIKKKAIVLDSGDLVGQGYNILIDRPTPAQIMKFETEEKDFDIVLPICAKVEKFNQTRSFQEQLKDKKSYVQSRLNNLNVSLDVQHDVFKMGLRAGFNRSETYSGEFSNSRYSTLRERRMFQVKIANFKEKKNGITFTSDFESDVKQLPDKYVRGDPKNRKRFERFFNRFGHFIVSSAYGGGAVEKQFTEQSAKSEDENVKEAKISFHASSVEPAGDLSSSSTAKPKVSMSTVQKNVHVHWYGGNNALHTDETLDSEEKMLKWETSLLDKPTLLTTEMSLEPISTVIGCIDDKKSEASYDALEDLLAGKFKLLVSKEEEEKEREKEMEKERKRIESNTRSECVEDPDTSGWWNSLRLLAVGIIALLAMMIPKLIK